MKEALVWAVRRTDLDEGSRAGHQRRELVAPLDQNEGIGLCFHLLHAEGEQFFVAVEAVKVEVVEPGAGAPVLVHEGEGGAG